MLGKLVQGEGSFLPKGFRREGDEPGNKVVKAFLGSLINEKLKRSLPGLYATLCMFTYGRFGEYPGELLYKRPEEFIKLLNEHLLDKAIANRILRYLLEDLEARGKYGKKAVESLLTGEYEAFRRFVEEAVRKEAVKWSRKLIS